MLQEKGAGGASKMECSNFVKSLELFRQTMINQTKVKNMLKNNF